MIRKKIILTILLTIILALTFNVHIVNADEAAPSAGATSQQDISNAIWGQATILGNAGGIIIGAIKWVGVAILVGAIIVKGMRFVSASPEGQASIKKEIVLLAIGAVLLFTFTSILGIIENVVSKAGIH